MNAAPRTMKKKRARRAIIVLIVVVAVVGAVAAPSVLGGDKSAKASVPTTTAVTGTLVVSATADGQTEASETYDVNSDVAGTVDDVYVQVGDRVEAGDQLFSIGEESLESVVRQAKAQVAQADQQVAAADQQIASAAQQLAAARLQLLQAEQNLSKLESLTGTMAVGSSRIAEAKQSVSVAQAGVKAAVSGQQAAKAARASAVASRQNAQSSYADARDDLKKTVVVAPAPGVVTSVNVAEGRSVAAGGAAADSQSAASVGGVPATDMSAGSAGSSAAIEIDGDSALLVRVAVSEFDIADVKVGQQATVTFDGATGLQIPAKVQWVSPNAVNNGNVRTYEAELELAEQSERLRPGMTASAGISTLSIEDALLVPKSSVRVDGTTKFVTVVKPDGTQVKRTVTTGRSDDVNVEILTGLKAGDEVTTTASEPTEESGAGGFMPPRPPSGM